MATDQNRKTGADPAAKADSKSAGTAVDPGPYEAIVVSHVQGTRMGQLLVYIPDFGGEKTDPNNQIVVSYCSPFYGTTYGTDQQDSSATAPDAQFTTGQSYGMWMVPPDIGNKVLVVFAAGSRDRGYWIGCIYDSASHHMVPAIGRNIGGENNSLPPTPADQLTPSINSNSNLPVVEGYSGDPTAYTPDGILSTKRYLHEYQAGILVMQGLDQDVIRGAISSSSLREAPSNVYGISTPGPSVTGTTPQVTATEGENPAQAVVARQGGHTFVMDDGDVNGVDQLIRLRTSGGHQILMNDSASILYIASSSGQQWMEFSDDGSISMYATGGFNLRSSGPMNYHSDSAIFINSNDIISINGVNGVEITSSNTVDVLGLQKVSLGTNGTLSASAGGGASVISGAALTLSGSGDTNIMGSTINLNNSGPASAPTIPDIVTNSLPDVSYNGTNWTFNPDVITSICTVAPAHEPWIDPTTGSRPTPATN